MPLSDFLVGFAFFVGTVGAALGAAGFATRRWYGALPPGPAAVAFGTLATGALLAAQLLPAMLGVLRRETALAAAVALLAAAARWARPVDRAAREPEPGAPSSRWSWLVAGMGVAALTVYVFAYARAEADEAIASIDALNFHLPQLARWIETGSVWQVDNFVPGWAFGNYPGAGNMVQLAAVLPWDNDAVVRYATYPFLLLAGLSVYAIACELGAPRAAAALFGAVFAALPTVGVIAISHAMPDAIMLAGFGAGALFLLRHARTGRAVELVPAGIGLGVAFGTKWYGVSAVAVVALVWAGGHFAGRRPLPRIARDAGLVALVAALPGGVWLLRNLVLSGNPVFPAELSPLGLTLFDAPPDPIREEAGFALSHYLSDPGVWEDLIAPALLDSFGWVAVLMLAAAAVALAFGLVALGRAGGDGGRLLAVAVAAVLLIGVYVATPYSAFGPDGAPLLVSAAARYAAPAVLLCAALAAWAVGRLGRAGIALEVVTLALMAEAMSRYGDFDPVIADFDFLEARPIAEGAIGALAAAALGYGTWALARRARPLRPAIPAIAAAGVLVLAGIAVAGHRQQRSFNDGRYVGVSPAYDWLRENASAGGRIGLAGVWGNDLYAPPWIAFGPRLGNEVEYVGPVVEERLERYPRPDAFRAALRRARLDALVVGRLGSVAEDEWARAEGWTPVATSDSLVVLVPPATAAARGRDGASR